MFREGRLLQCAIGLLTAAMVRPAVAEDTGGHVKIPSIVGPYVTVYRPLGDRYPGPDTPQLKAGQFYPDWVPNDHAIIKGSDERWHAIGITHPLDGRVGRTARCALGKQAYLDRIREAGFESLLVVRETTFPMAEQDERLKGRIVSIAVTAYK